MIADFPNDPLRHPGFDWKNRAPALPERRQADAREAPAEAGVERRNGVEAPVLANRGERRIREVRENTRP